MNENQTQNAGEARPAIRSTEWLGAQVTLDIQELDPELRIATEIYDDAGNIIGEISGEEWEAERAKRHGKRQFAVTATCNGKRLTVLSPYDDVEKRDVLLGGALEMIGKAIVRGAPNAGDQRRLPGASNP